MYVARQGKEIEKSVRCPKCGGVHVSYASMRQTSSTCHDCGFTEIQNTIVAGGKDPAGELIKVIATGALVVIGIAGAISLAKALFGDSKG